MVRTGLSLFGALNALYFLPLLLTNKNRKNLEIVAQGRLLPSGREACSILLTFGLTVVAWIFFRAENVGHALSYIGEMFSSSFFSMPDFTMLSGALTTIVLLAIFVVIEWIGREGQYAIAHLGLQWKRPIRYAMYYAMLIAILWFSGQEQEFIYFQF